MLPLSQPLNPLHFFEIGCDLHYLKKGGVLTPAYRLPTLTSFFKERGFATVFMGWNEEGIYCDIHLEKGELKAFFPDIRKGDSVELFFDTRNMKNAHYAHKFCHHFFFLPKKISDGEREVQQGEMTRFRGEDRHELANPSSLILDMETKKKVVYHIFIPKEALFGYDPRHFNRLGFTYRINKRGGDPQFFSASSDEYAIEQHPHLWATFQLKENV